MANTYERNLQLTPEAIEALAQLSSSVKTKGVFVSDLIMVAWQRNQDYLAGTAPLDPLTILSIRTEAVREDAIRRSEQRAGFDPPKSKKTVERRQRNKGGRPRKTVVTNGDLGIPVVPVPATSPAPVDPAPVVEPELVFERQD